MTFTAQAELQTALAPGSLICLDTNCLLYYFKGEMPWTDSLLVNEYIHRHNDFTGFFTKSNVTRLTESIGIQ